MWRVLAALALVSAAQCLVEISRQDSVFMIRGKKAPISTVYREDHYPLLVQCAFQCQKEPLCVAYNYFSTSGTCQLSGRIVEVLQEDPQAAYYHKGAYAVNQDSLGVCGRANPCGEQGRCLDEINDQGEQDYTCVCVPYWKGRHCDVNKGKPYWGPWEAWTTCSATCGLGHIARERKCIDPQTKAVVSDRHCYGAQKEFTQCSISECPRWGVWTAWTECTSNRTCGQGMTSRERQCEFGGTVNQDPGCTGTTNDRIPCFSPDCAGGVYLANDDVTVDGYGEGRVMVFNDRTGSWGQVCNAGWDREDADVACRQVGLAGVNQVSPGDMFSAGSEPFYMFSLSCSGSERTLQQCQHGGWVSAGSCKELGGTGAAGVRCAVHGAWSDWSSWGACSVTCHEGQQQRDRECNNPPAKRQGRPCSGDGTESRPCQMGPCPIDGRWSEWTDWGECTRQCGGGTRQSSRTCIQPQHGGLECDGYDKREENCNTDPCPVDGYWGSWGNWTACTDTCGTGNQHRLRSCIEPLHGGNPCTAQDGKLDRDTRDCNPDPCPVDGYWLEWREWETCNVTCGGGSSSRYRDCNQPLHGGAACDGPANQTESCNDLPCPVDGVFLPWSEWSDCPVPCGGSVRSRARLCDGPFHGGENCTGDWSQEQGCNTNPCPVDGEWLSWTHWSSCSEECGGGSRNRERDCTPPLHGGFNCSGEWSQTEDCNEHPCPVEGYWKTWTAWAECDNPCGGGETWRSRVCVPPLHGGKNCSGPGREVQVCNDFPCPIDGEWRSWADWGKCSELCGGGVQFRGRECIQPQHGGRDCQGDAEEDQACNTQPCPVDGYYRQWSKWNDCTKTCGTGKQQRERTCVPPRHDGLPCQGEPTESRNCNQQPCPIDGQYEPWLEWTDCSVTCGPGNNHRERTCVPPQHGGKACQGEPREDGECNNGPCPVDGKWTEWTDWTDCSRTCGGGLTNRTRFCNEPLHGGAACEGEALQVERCNHQICPVDGYWTQWSGFSECTESCENGTQYRDRTCVPPIGSGNDCEGAAREFKACNEQPCPVDSVWSDWSPWTACAVSCGGGKRYRYRKCNEGKHGGQPCVGHDSEEDTCNTHFCPVDSTWQNWQPWEECNVTCGGGTRSRQRACTPPQYAGRKCTGNSAEQESCNNHHCPVDGSLTEWSAWTVCSSQCGPGQQERTRSCTEPEHGGSNCDIPESSFRQTQKCQVKACPVDGQLTPWSTWSSCTKSCAGGSKTRSRTCSPPLHGGRPCPLLPTTQIGQCNNDLCPVDGFWTQWEDWSICSKTCDTGSQNRERTCVPPVGAGKDCQGSEKEVVECNGEACPDKSVWSAWLPWTVCDTSCGGGERHRYRKCDEKNRTPCAGLADETEECNTHLCPVAGFWLNWESWSSCSSECGGGSRSRQRFCVPPSFGGEPCQGPNSQDEACNQEPCAN